jgi:hypothetical protein
MSYLVGRPRVAAGVLTEIPYYEDDTVPKQDVLRKAIRASVYAYKTKLAARFREDLIKSTLQSFTN